MQSTKFTPGPWYYSGNPPIGQFEVSADSGTLPTICKLSRFNQQANARLIASAPELLDALIEAENTLIDMDSNHGGAGIALPMVQAAIAKATQ